MKKKLPEVYDPKKFKEFGHELIDLLADHLENSQNEKVDANNWIPPTEQLNFWENYKIDKDSPTPFFKEIIDRSINLHHPKYIGHQIAPPAPLSALSGLLGAVLNNGMAVYEMGPAASAIEKVVIDKINEKIGFNNQADGFITSGGTLANLTALLSARSAMAPTDVWEEGSNEQLAVMVSAEAHYCVDRALRIMGFGSKGIIKIPVTEGYEMQTDLLNEYYKKAIDDGLHVIAVVGSAPSTSTGIHDNLDQIAAFCELKKIWFHIDGAHGGAAIFSEKYKPLLNGIHRADSVAIDGHKMLMTPSIMTFLLYKNKSDSYATFSQKAAYLWEKSEEEEWYNYAKRTFECTKYMMSIQFYCLLKFYGTSIFDEFVTSLYDLGHDFSEKVKNQDSFELALPPQSNIVCFRYLPKSTHLSLNEVNSQIRSTLLSNGEFYIVQTLLKDKVYLRVTFMNPKTNHDTMDSLLNKIKEIGQDITSKNQNTSIV